AEGTVSPQSLTFTPANYNTPQTVTITGVDDTVLDFNQLYHITFSVITSADPSYSNHMPNPANVAVTNLDNEVVRMRRLYDPHHGSHFFTTSQVEFDAAVQAGDVDETSQR